MTFRELYNYLQSAQPHDYEAIYDTLMDVLDKLSAEETAKHRLLETTEREG